MKHFISPAAVAATALICATSCSIKEDRTLCTSPVHVTVDNFSIVQEDFPATRTVQRAADYEGVETISLAFFDGDGTKVYESAQLRSDTSTYTTFGEFSLRLPYGNYTMVVLGSASTSAMVLTSPTSAAMGEDKVRETFACSRSVTVDGTTDLSATLSRIISRLVVQSSDGRPEDIVSFHVTLSKGGKTFNPSTGLALTDNGFTNIIEPSTAAGATVKLTTNLFLFTDEEGVDITVEGLDSEGNAITYRSATGVPLKRNRATTISGNIFLAGSSGSFSLESDWLEDQQTEF